VTSDGEQRYRAVHEADRSFIVEASAGTGKTNTLTKRILNLVLEKGPFGPPLRLHQICAITFTEKAAGEMKIRLRQSFEQIAFSANNLEMPAVMSELAREALADVEIASISTFPAFAVSLLKERPIEAGLDPHFTALDEIRSELFFRDVWDSWISRAISERRPVLERALRGGISLATLQALARILRQSGYAVRNLPCDEPPDEAQVRNQIRSLLQLGQSFLERNLSPKDKLAGYLEKAIDWLKNPGPGQPPRPSKPGGAGSATNWDQGKTTVEEVREFIRDVVDFCASFDKLPAQRLLHELIQWIRMEFMQEWEGRKRAGGWLDFDDQLWFARNLLLRSRAVRREFQTRYATLLVDEFQDTDPVQWDLVRLLTSSDLNETDPAKLRPGPGRLFIVGDPKQSIYRFRNADIETYLEIADPMAMQSLGLEHLQLTTNFRSVPSILRFVDTAFAGVMSAPADGRYQPDYLAFGEGGSRKEELNPPSVYLLGDRTWDEESAGTVREFIEREASRIAGLIRQIPGSTTWNVRNTEEEGWRAPRYGDIAILLPVLSHADVLEDALRDREIPYVLEGGKFYYARSEVSSAITALRAIANPNDSVALYGALRSIFFGFSDEDLLRARVAGQKLDYRAAVSTDSLTHPFEILRDLHRHRHDRRASETLELLLQRTGAREVLAVRGLQSIANLSKLARTLRTFQREMTFSQVVELLATMDEDGLAESESRLMEERSDAVRILSIHKSKGLDFPIVFVAGLGFQRRNQTKNLLADLHGKKVFGLSLGSRESGLQTPGWKSLAEEEHKRENAELVRLLYVALTRARDHLVLSTHTQNWKMPESGGQWIPDTERTRLKPLSSFIEDCISKETDLVRWIDLNSLEAPPKPSRSGLSALPDWRSIMERECRSLCEILSRTPASQNLQAAGKMAEGVDDADREPEERGRDVSENRSVRLGTAFHEAMERVHLSSPGEDRPWIRELIAQHSLDPKSVRSLEEMIGITLSSDLLQRARQAAKSGGRILREVPFVRPLQSAGVEEGKIDLLFEEGDGWVLVDYKTDWVSALTQEAEDHFRQKYSAQIREYIKALHTLPIKVVSAYILLARTGSAIQIDY
jgi:ATP-dependent helicase/nuclease subunit A